MPSTWKTIRVFISSTFRDMHAERDHLVKVVFPELRERCEKRRLHLIDVDLRWGVTEEEAEQGKVLEIILDEVERSRPFFIGILGERYGSIPDDIPEDAKFAHPWLQDYPDHSLTALEIVHGVLSNPELSKRSFFYFRDPHFISKMPENMRGDFIAENSDAAQKLAALKDEIRTSGRSVLENYPCRWDESKESLTDLDVFGQQVLEDMWTAISEEYPEDAPESDPLTIERQMHKAFAEERSHLHTGRIEEAALLTKHVKGTDSQPVVITGESGSGKSAFLATWYRRYVAEHPDDYVLAYFIGASPDSTDHMRLLRNMCKELKSNFDLEENLPEDDKNLSEVLTTFLLTASQARRIVILLDALDQLSAKEGSHGLGWLLDYLPAYVHLVISSLEGDSLEVLRRRGAKEIPLQQLTIDEQRQIVHAQLNEWGRKLDEQQISALLAHPGVENPLYLRVALEELRLFGSYEQLTPQIKALAPDVSNLFDQVLDRLEEDHGREVVTEAFSLLGCSRYGLSENELLELLRREGEETLPRVLWVRLSRSAKAYLVQRGELVGFFHHHLADAVAARYLTHENKHAKLASYFKQRSLERKLDEYPYQLQHAEEWKYLAVALSDLDFFEYAWNQERKYEWMGYWRSLQGHFEPGICYQKAIETRERVEGKNIALGCLLNICGIFLHEMALYPFAIYFKERALEIIKMAFGPDHPDVAASLNNLAFLYYSQGKYAEAEPLYRQALEIMEKVFEPNHSKVATFLNNLALLYYSQGKYTEAEPLYRQAIELREKILRPDHPDIATSLNNLALLYHSQGKYAEAEPLYRQALEIMEKVFGPDHSNVAIYLNNLAETYYSQGKYAEAEPLYKRSIGIKEKILGLEHPDIATSLNSLALFYWSQGKYAKAEPRYKRALEIMEKTIGTKHPNFASSLNNLALLYYSQGKYAEAEPLYKRSIEIKEKILGLEHPDVATSLSGLAELYGSQGKYAEAEPLYGRALKINKNTFGPNHPEVASSLNKLANFYYLQGKFTKAEPLYVRSLEIRENALRPDHPDVATSMNNLAQLYHSQGKFAEAEPRFRRALEISEKALGPDHPDVATSLNNLARLYHSQGKFAEAEPRFRRALEIREKVLGLDHLDVATSLNSLARLYDSQGKYVEAESTYNRELEIIEKALGPDHPDVARSLNNLAFLYYHQGKYVKAEPLYRRALEIMETAFGSDDPNVIESLSYLALLYYEQGKYAEAEPLFRQALEIMEIAFGPDHSDTEIYRDNLKTCKKKMKKHWWKR